MAQMTVTYFDRAIEVVAQSPRLEMLQNRLRQNGMRPIRAQAPVDPSRPEPLLLDMASAPSAQAVQAFAYDWQQAQTQRILVTLGPAPEALKILELIELIGPDRIAALPAYIAARERAVAQANELALREQTLLTLDNKTAIRKSMGPKRSIGPVIWLGAPHGDFNALRLAMQTAGLDLQACLSAQTAQDRLRQQDVQAILIAPQTASDAAATFLARHCPSSGMGQAMVILVDQRQGENHLGLANAAKADAIIELGVNPGAFVTKLMRALAIPMALSTAALSLKAQTHDLETGLYSTAFLKQHLPRQMADARHKGAPLSLIGISTKSTETDMKPAAKLVKQHLRTADFGARLDRRHLCLVLPLTDFRGASGLARRIEATADVSIRTRVIEMRAYHSAEMVLSALTATAMPSAKRTA